MEIDERFVADVIGPQCLPVAMINTIVCQAGDTFETWIHWGKKNWRLAVGTLDEMNKKAERVRRFAADPLAPVPSSVAEFVMMAKGI